METQVTTYYLELRSVEEFTPSGTEVPDLEIREARIACPELGRFLYTVVGRAWALHRPAELAVFDLVGSL